MMPEPDVGATIRTSVAVVGGGPVGTALAITLAQRDIDVLLIEKHATPQPVPKGQNLTQRSAEHFRTWGIVDQLYAARTMSATQQSVGMTAYGSLDSGDVYPWLRRSSVAPFYAAQNLRLPQYRTEAVLRERVAALPTATARYEWTAVSLAQDSDRAAVSIVSRATGERRMVVADYVVGADGSDSLVREAAGITQTRADHDRRMVLLVFRSKGLDQVMAAHPEAAFVNVLHPRLEGYWQFFGRVDASETWFFHCPVDPASTAATIDLAAILARAVGRRIDIEVQHLGFWDLRFALADTYRAGRVLIAGDAAHSHPPYGGYGINSGFEDARNLGWKLAAQLEGWAGPALLDSYDAERRPVFASTRDDFIARSILEDRDFLAAYDPAQDRAGFETAWRARRDSAVDEVDRFEPHYEGSPVIGGEGQPSAVGHHELTARPGHHLAPGMTAAGKEIFPTTGSGFILLHAVGVDPGGIEGTAAELGVPLAAVAIDDASASRYGASLLLVRPDQFVAWAGDDPADGPAALRRAIGA